MELVKSGDIDHPLKGNPFWALSVLVYQNRLLVNKNIKIIYFSLFFRTLKKIAQTNLFARLVKKSIISYVCFPTACDEIVFYGREIR